MDNWRNSPLICSVITRCRWLAWLMAGRPKGDRHSFSKRVSLAKLGKRFACQTLVESGTYLGDTVAAMRGHFSRVISIELSVPLHERAQRRFRKCADVVLLQGDSGQRIVEALPLIEGRTLFWLDGHYSGGFTARGAGECPVLAELEAISKLNRRDHVILIDDARLFGVNPDYPAVDVVRARLAAINPEYSIEIVDDAIQALPRIT
jgi:hypothetical protein